MTLINAFFFGEVTLSLTLREKRRLKDFGKINVLRELLFLVDVEKLEFML